MKKTIIILTTIILFVLPKIVFSQNNPLIPADFKIPEMFQNEHFKIRMLTVSDIVKDYDTVMSSIDHLQGVFGNKEVKNIKKREGSHEEEQGRIDNQ